MALLKERPFYARPQLKAGPSIGDPATVLLPALAAVRRLRNSVEAMTFLQNEVPEHLWLPLIDVLTTRNGFDQSVVKELVQVVGLDRIRRELGQRAANLIAVRFFKPALT